MRVRVVVFTGTGRAFCAGDDLRAYRDAELGGKPLVPADSTGPRQRARHLQRTAHDLPATQHRRALASTNSSIAAINGVAIQTGFSLALSCDFRIAARRARIGSATLRFGLLPDEGGQYLLVQLLGRARRRWTS